MQAYQSPPCPYCGATWNQPGAQACANCRNPLPPPQPTYAPPGYAQGQPPGPPQGYGAPGYPPQAYPQQPQYPGAPPGYPGQPGYPAYGPPGYPQQAGAYGPDPGYAPYPAQGQPAAAAGTTLQLFGRTLTLPLALPPALLQYPERIARGAARVGFVIVALLVLLVLFIGVIPAVASGQTSSATQTLKAAANEIKVIQPYNDALADYTKIGVALAKHDLVAAGAPYPDAQQKIELALSYSHAAGLPPQIAKQVSSFSEVMTNTESLVQAIQAKDAAGIKQYTDARNAALTAMATPAETVPAD